MKLFITCSLCVSLELLKLTVVSTSISALGSQFSKGKKVLSRWGRSIVKGRTFKVGPLQIYSHHHATAPWPWHSQYLMARLDHVVMVAEMDHKQDRKHFQCVQVINEAEV